MANSLDLLIHSLMVTKCTSQEQIRRVHSSIRDSMVGVMDLSELLICHKNLVLFTILKFSYLESQLTTLVWLPYHSSANAWLCMPIISIAMYSVFPQAAGIFNYKVQANKCGICEMVRASNCIQHPSKGRTHGKFENNHTVHLRMPRPIT